MTESDRRRAAARDARDFLPLTHLLYYVLLALAETPAHGYALVGRIREQSGGVIDPGTGSFYSIIRSAADSGLIEERPTAGAADGRRREFAITRLGREVLNAEARRLTTLSARTRRVLARS
jgi:DNA-binding PadR family transcriptional regulator